MSKNCPLTGCNYPGGECSGECRTPRDWFDAALPEMPGLPIYLVHADPAPAGDPWPYHLCMPGVDWPAPAGAVLRPDSKPRSCPPCTRNCYQGRDCPARVVSVSGSRVYPHPWLQALPFVLAAAILSAPWVWAIYRIFNRLP